MNQLKDTTLYFVMARTNFQNNPLLAIFTTKDRAQAYIETARVNHETCGGSQYYYSLYIHRVWADLNWKLDEMGALLDKDDL